MSYSVVDIAKKIISKTDTERGDIISNLKLQKMLYYMQGFHLAAFNEPLFEEEIEAWQYGPVVPSVYEEFKSFGSGAIELEEGYSPIELKEEEEDLFGCVYEEYGQFSAIKLMNMTHDESPWKSTPLKKVIEKVKMQEFFKTQLEEA